MTPAEALFWHRLQRRVATLEPDLARDILRAFEYIRAHISETDFARLVAANDPLAAARLLDDQLLDRAFAPLRDRLYRQTSDGVRFFARDLPIANVSRAGIMFDVLNPRMIAAIRALDTKVIEGLKGDVRATVIQVVERGLKDGVNPRTVARELRASIGLGAAQDKQVANFRAALEARDAAKAKSYLLRDRRYDKMIARGDASPAQLEKMVDIYRKRRIAQNAETVARTAALDAQKQAQHLSWQSAIDRGIVDPATLLKRWVGTLDSRERELHLQQEGETIGFDEAFSLTGEVLPGESTYNCRCLLSYSTRTQRRPPQGVSGNLATARQARR